LISFRYHIFTIVAIFLAVGLGLLFGTSVVQPALIHDLRRQVDQLTKEGSDTRAEVGDLRAQVGDLEKAGDILAAVDPGTLNGAQVVLVTHDGVDAGLLSEARRSLSEAGTKIVAILSVTDRMAATDEQSRQTLAQLLDMSAATDAATLQDRAAQILAQRLAAGGTRRGVQLAGSDPLEAFLAANFLTTPAGSPAISSSDLPGIGGKDQIVVVLSGGNGEPAVTPQAFFVPLVDDLVQRGATVAAGESASTDYPFVTALRSTGDPAAARMVTVDDLDFSVGGAALVLGLERLKFLGQGGNYGIKAGSTAPLPPLS
jgi:hypothetical protein